MLARGSVTGRPPILRRLFRGFDPALERDYRAAILAADRRTNLYALTVAIPLYALYSLIDAITLVHAREGIAFRLLSALAAFGPLLAIKAPQMRERHELLTLISVVFLGAGINLIVWIEPSLSSHNYYVAHIQGAIFVSFLARLSFFRSMAVLASFLAGFVLAVQGKQPAEDAMLQVFILVTMFSMCAFGIFLTQKLRRQDFLNTRTIASQNEKLNEKLANERLESARKVAAMNLLVHFVKTPLHQIGGFTDLITRALETEGPVPSKDTLECARFIKCASRELTQNVSRLLTYYRLDDSAASSAVELVELAPLIADSIEHVSERMAVKPALEKVAVYNRQRPMIASVAALLDHYSLDGRCPGRLDVALRRSAEGAELTLTDDLAPMSAEEFAQSVKPLDKLDHYLTANGADLAMALRTAARAAELCGGRLAWRPAERGNAFTLTFADLKPEAEAQAA